MPSATGTHAAALTKLLRSIFMGCTRLSFRYPFSAPIEPASNELAMIAWIVRHLINSLGKRFPACQEQHMLLESLRQQVLHANHEIARRGLAPHTFGNASGIDRTGTQP